MQSRDGRNEARERFKATGLGIEGCRHYGESYWIEYMDVAKLRELCCEAVEDDRAVGGFSAACDMRMSDEIDFENRPNGYISSAFLYVDSDYFEKREAVSFNQSGFVGFAGWASDEAVKPFVTAFNRWCNLLEERECRQDCKDRVCRTCAIWTQSTIPADHYCGWHRHVTNPDDFCSRWREDCDEH